VNKALATVDVAELRHQVDRNNNVPRLAQVQAVTYVQKEST